MLIKTGQAAPLFVLKSDEGIDFDLSELRGKFVVIYFYPKDDTPGCTIEAQDFSKKISSFEKLDCVVAGISKDSISSHCKFVNKYNLSIPLLADESGHVCDLYGVIQEKSMFGKKYLGINRSTFLIDKLGKIIEIWSSVKVKGHVDEVLQSIERQLKSS